jgi:hypothetical protein
MDADLDPLLIAVYVTADDLLPQKPENAKRSVTDAEVVTLCVAQAIMGIPSDRRFLRVASKAPATSARSHWSSGREAADRPVRAGVAIAQSSGICR